MGETVSQLWEANGRMTDGSSFLFDPAWSRLEERLTEPGPGCQYGCRKPNRQVKIMLIMFLLSTTGASLSRGAQPDNSGRVARVCAVCQSWSAEDRNLEHVLAMMGRAAEQKADIVCLPEGCVPTDGGSNAHDALKAIAKAAGAGKMYVAANLNEREGEKLYSSGKG